jgi:hypothetical protein
MRAWERWLRHVELDQMVVTRGRGEHRSPVGVEGPATTDEGHQRDVKRGARERAERTKVNLGSPGTCRRARGGRRRTEAAGDVENVRQY